MPSNTPPKVKKVVKKVKKVKSSPNNEKPEVSHSTTESSVVETQSTVDSSTNVSTVSGVDDVQEVAASFKELVSALNGVQTQVRSAIVAVRATEKLVTKKLREANKKNRKKNKDSNKSKRAPSGFAKPSLISNELSQFLGKPENTMMARTEVTKYLTKYIKDHNLQDPLNKRKIVPDDALKKVLNVSDEEDVTYFNLQKHMKHHFPKAGSSVASS